MRATAVLFRGLETFKVHDGHGTVAMRPYFRQFKPLGSRSQVRNVELNLRVVRANWDLVNETLPTFTGARSLKIRRANEDTWETMRRVLSISPWARQLTTLHLDECNWPTFEMLTNILRGFRRLERLVFTEQSWRQTGFSRMPRPPALPNVREVVLQGVTELRNARKKGKFPLNKGGPHVLDWLAGQPMNWAPTTLELGWEACYYSQEAEIHKIMKSLGKNVRHLAILPHARVNKTTLSPKTVDIGDFTQLRTLAFKQLDWDDLAPALETTRGNNLTDLHLQFCDDPATQKMADTALANVDNALACEGLKRLKTLHLQLPSIWRGNDFEQTVRECMPRASERRLLRVYQASEEVDLRRDTDDDDAQSKQMASSSPTPQPDTASGSPVSQAGGSPATS